MVKRLEIECSYDTFEEIKEKLEEEGLWKPDYVYRIVSQGKRPTEKIRRILKHGTDRTRKEGGKWDYNEDEINEFRSQFGEELSNKLKVPKNYTFAHPFPKSSEEETGIREELSDVPGKGFLMLIYTRSRLNTELEGIQPVYIFKGNPLEALVALVQVNDESLIRN